MFLGILLHKFHLKELVFLLWLVNPFTIKVIYIVGKLYMLLLPSQLIFHHHIKFLLSLQGNPVYCLLFIPSSLLTKLFQLRAKFCSKLLVVNIFWVSSQRHYYNCSLLLNCVVCFSLKVGFISIYKFGANLFYF